MLRRSRLAYVIPALLMVSACSKASPAAPSTLVEVLATNYSLGCGGWSPAVPPVRRTVVDMQFIGGETSRDAGLEAIRLNGGIVTHTFAAGGYVRAEIDVDRLLPLHVGPERFLWHAVTVSNPASFRVSLIVGLDHYPTDDDVGAAESVGATVTRRFTLTHAYVVEIEDAHVPLLRALPGVRSIAANGVGCITGAQTGDGPDN